jgi:DNA-binding transcriptional regulator/RsmH inhibitor MraZ
MSNYINFANIVQKYNVGKNSAQKILDDAKIEVSLEIAYGRGKQKLYDAVAVQKAFDEFNERLKQEKEKSVPVKDFSKQNTALLESVASEVLDNSNRLQLLSEKIEQISSQNAIMFKTIEKNQVELKDRLAAMQALIVSQNNQRDKLQSDIAVNMELMFQNLSEISLGLSKVNDKQEVKPQLAQVDSAVTITAPDTKSAIGDKVSRVSKPETLTNLNKIKKKVCVVGLLPDQTQILEKEFSDDFQLKYFESDKAKGPSFNSWASSSSAVLLMTAFCNHGIESSIRASKGKLIRITGGMSTLRQKLTELRLDA